MDSTAIQAMIRDLTTGSDTAARHFLDHFSPLIYHEIQATARHLRAESEPGELEGLAADFCAFLGEGEFQRLRDFAWKVDFTAWIRALARDFVCGRLVNGRPETAPREAPDNAEELFAAISDDPAFQPPDLPSRQELGELIGRGIRELSSRDRLLLQLAGRADPPATLTEIAGRLHLPPKYAALAPIRLRNRLTNELKSRQRKDDNQPCARD